MISQRATFTLSPDSLTVLHCNLITGVVSTVGPSPGYPTTIRPHCLLIRYAYPPLGRNRLPVPGEYICTASYSKIARYQQPYEMPPSQGQKFRILSYGMITILQIPIVSTELCCID